MVTIYKKEKADGNENHSENPELHYNETPGPNSSAYSESVKSRKDYVIKESKESVGQTESPLTQDRHCEGLESEPIENAANQDNTICEHDTSSVSSSSDGKVQINGFTGKKSDDLKLKTNHMDPEEHSDDAKSHVARQNRAPKLPLFLKTSLVIGNCFLATLPFGFLIGLGVLFVEIIDEFNSTRAEAFPIISVYIGIMFGGGAIMGPLLNKYNAGKIMLLGAFGILIGCIICYLAPSIIVLVIAQAFTGIGLSLTFILPFAIIGEMFEERRIIMITIVGAFSGIGKVYFPYLTSVLNDAFGWRGTFLILGAFFLNCIPVGILIMIFRKIRQRLLGPQKANFKSLLNFHLFKNPAFLVFAYNSFFVNTMFSTLDMFFIDMLRSRHFDERRGPFLLSVTGFANIGGKVLFTLLSPFLKCKRMTILPLFIFLCSMVVLTYAYFETYTQLLVICILFGFFWGNCTVVYPAIVLEISGLKMYATALGYINLIGGMAGFLGGPLVGSIKDVTNSYRMVYYVSTGLGLLSCSLTILVILSRKYQERKEKSTADYETNSTLMTKLH